MHIFLCVLLSTFIFTCVFSPCLFNLCVMPSPWQLFSHSLSRQGEKRGGERSDEEKRFWQQGGGREELKRPKWRREMRGEEAGR